MKKILVFGATSLIAEHICRLYAKSGDSLYLVGRRENALDNIASDLVSRGASRVKAETSDLDNTDAHSNIFLNADENMGGIDLILIAHGVLPDQIECQQSCQQTLKVFQTNLVSSISILTLAANYFEERNDGTIVAISSVAGDRARKSNYVYGTTKSAMSFFLQGLRNRFYGSNINIVTIKPGFVDTPMTKDYKKGFLWAQPEDIAKGIQKAVEQRKSIVFLPWYWKFIMVVVRLLPEAIIHKYNI